jgi:hypothetical protein
MRWTPIQPNYGSNSHKILGDVFFLRVLPVENFFGFCEKGGGHDWAFTQKSMQFLALCQGCSGSIVLWKSISSQQVAIFMHAKNAYCISIVAICGSIPAKCLPTESMAEVLFLLQVTDCHISSTLAARHAACCCRCCRFEGGDGGECNSFNAANISAVRCLRAKKRDAKRTSLTCGGGGQMFGGCA